MSETWWRRVLYVAGAWNVVGGVSALADPARHFAQLYGAALSLDEPVQVFFFRATWINVIAWGLGYLLAAGRPAARGPVLIAGGAGKLVYFGACLTLVGSGRGTAMLLTSGVLDVIFAGCFFYILWLQRDPASRGGGNLQVGESHARSLSRRVRA